MFKVFVGSKDGANSNLENEVNNLGVRGIKRIKEFTVYWLSGILEKELRTLINKALYNPITQIVLVGKIPSELAAGANKIEVVSNLGVIDSRESSVKRAALDLGIKKEVKVKFGRLYLLYGKINKKPLALIKRRLLMKEVIEHEVRKGEDPFIKADDYKLKLVTVPMTKVPDPKLMKISESGGLSLTLEEMREIKRFFKDLGREPTDVELETIAQTWSEHCSHKTLRGNVVHNGERIKNLLDTTIIDPSQKLNKKYVVSAFKDNAGGISIGNNVVCVKVETHNHPSAIEPVGGAETGTGGVIRDILGFGKGAKPISSIVCFGVGPQNISFERLPKGALHPKVILSGIVAGTKSYGNQIGIPTDFFQDSLVVHRDYIGNPLVYCGTVGVTKNNLVKKTNPKKGDLVFLLGGLTGRDGIHGATFSSAKLQEESESISGGSVQIGDAITEKKTLDAILEMTDKGLVSWVTDCGGGGLSSAVGETAEKVGVRVDLDKVPVKYKGLTYTEIWISESQERMVVVSDPRYRNNIINICKKHDVLATVIGKFTGKNKLGLYYKDKQVADLDMNFLHNGCPKIEKTSTWKKRVFREPKISRENLSKVLLELLKNPDIGSKSKLAHQYDSTVQGRTFFGPLSLNNEDVHTDVSIRQITPNSSVGLALAISVNPHLTTLNPRSMAHWVIAQALGKLAACGANISHAALLDNFSWGSPSKPRVMGELVESLIGCGEAVEWVRVPFISGKDSLNNEYRVKNKEISIPGTLLLTAIAPVKDVRKIIKPSFEKEGDYIFLLGFTDGRMGGSYYYRQFNHIGNNPPKIDFIKEKSLLDKFYKAARAGFFKSSALVGKGGMAVTLARMCLGTRHGAKIYLSAFKRKTKLKDSQILFSESGLQFIVEVEKGKEKKLQNIFSRLEFEKIGKVGGIHLEVSINKRIINESLDSLSKSYNACIT